MRPPRGTAVRAVDGEALVHGGVPGREDDCPPPTSSTAAFMPHKKNANGRHHIPKMRHAVTNWAEYEGGLRRRGSVTLWINDEAIAVWAATRRATPGGQAAYSDSTGLKVYGAGQWQTEKHGRLRRTWRKLHLGVDALNGQIVAESH